MSWRGRVEAWRPKKRVLTHPFWLEGTGEGRRARKKHPCILGDSGEWMAASSEIQNKPNSASASILE